MKFLVDSNILSEATKQSPDPHVLMWLEQHESEFVVDPIVLGELRFGILLLPEGKRRQRLEEWFRDGVQKISCLFWDEATGLRWAKLLAQLRANGENMPVRDSMIAASALVHDLAVVTRNTQDFTRAGIEVINPFHRTEL